MLRDEIDKIRAEIDALKRTLSNEDIALLRWMCRQIGIEGYRQDFDSSYPAVLVFQTLTPEERDRREAWHGQMGLLLRLHCINFLQGALMFLQSHDHCGFDEQCEGVTMAMRAGTTYLYLVNLPFRYWPFDDKNDPFQT